MQQFAWSWKKATAAIMHTLRYAILHAVVPVWMVQTGTDAIFLAAFVGH
jgi:hypothetical protein